MNSKQCKKVRKVARQVSDLEPFGYLRNKIKRDGFSKNGKKYTVDLIEKEAVIKYSPITLTNCYRKVVKNLKNRFKKLKHTEKVNFWSLNK